MCFKNFDCSKKTFHSVIWVIIVVVVLLLTFQAGRFVGFRQAIFSGRLGDNYFRAIEGGPGRGPLGMMGPRGFWSDDLPNGHGAAGKIIKINLPNIVVIGPDNLEKVIKVDDDTIIGRFRDKIKANDLKVGDSIIAIGTANESSEIVAKLIRLLPPPPLPLPLPASTTNNQ